MSKAFGVFCVSLLVLSGCVSVSEDGNPSYRHFRYEMTVSEALNTYSGVEACKLRHRHFQDTYSRKTEEWAESLEKIHVLILMKFKWPKPIFEKVRAGQLQKEMTPIQAYCSVGFQRVLGKA